jgi:hypothetical protein
MEFDVNSAIATALDRRSKLDQDRDARFQKEEREKLNLMSETQLRINQGKRMVELAESELQGLKGKDEPQRTAFEYTRMAEGYALQGDYEAAFEMTADYAKKCEYQKILEALDGKQECSCPKSVRISKSSLPTQYIKEKIYDAVRKREVALKSCSLCGNLTI